MTVAEKLKSLLAPRDARHAEAVHAAAAVEKRHLEEARAATIVLDRARDVYERWKEPERALREAEQAMAALSRRQNVEREEATRAVLATETVALREFRTEVAGWRKQVQMARPPRAEREMNSLTGRERVVNQEEIDLISDALYGAFDATTGRRAPSVLARIEASLAHELPGLAPGEQRARIAQWRDEWATVFASIALPSLEDAQAALDRVEARADRPVQTIIP
jgi:hypothetical protein